MQTYIESLAILLNLPHNVHTARAAYSLVAREVVKSNPIPSLAECDAELVAINGGN